MQRVWSFGAGLLVLAMALPPRPVAAQGPDEDPDVAEVQRLFRQADSEYQTSNYGRAVETFTEAFTLSSEIDDPELRDAVRTSILFNLARAHVKAYGVDRDASHLRSRQGLAHPLPRGAAR